MKKIRFRGPGACLGVQWFTTLECDGFCLTDGFYGIGMVRVWGGRKGSRGVSEIWDGPLSV